MSANPQVEDIVTLPTPQVVPEQAEPLEPPAAEAPVAEETAATPAAAKARRTRPAWFGMAIVGATALIASSTLGYDAYAASQQRDGLYTRLVATTATLGSTQSQLAAANADAASKKVTAAYVAMYVADAGKVETDYQNLSACDGFGSCRTTSQKLLDDMQAFQSDRKAAEVPAALGASDSSLGDALSAAIAADDELISGMDSGDITKFKDGFRKLDAAMLSIGKAEASLGAELK